MIGKSIIGALFGGCISYCLDPKKDPEILEVNGLFEGSKKELIQQFNTISAQAPNVKKPVWHSTISFAHSDIVDDQLIKTVAIDFLKSMGLENNQYILIKHNDTKHVHAHLVINRVGFDGSLARDWKCKFRTMKVMQELEIKYELTVAKDQENQRKVNIKNAIDTGISKGESLNQVFKRVENLGFKIKINKTSNGKIRGVGFRDVEKGIYF